MNSFVQMLSRLRSYFPAVSKSDQLLARTMVILACLIVLGYFISYMVLFEALLGILAVISIVGIFVIAFISPVEDTPSEDD